MLLSVDAQGLDKAIARLEKKAGALADLTPAYKRFAAEIVKKTDDSFHNSVGYDGELWEPLAESTIARRVGALKSANQRTESGKLTKKAQKMREQMLAPGGIKPLIDTARARNSNHADVSADGIEWSAVGYLGYHMGGTERVPVRNPSPFVWDGNAWQLRDSALKSLTAHVTKHVSGER